MASTTRSSKQIEADLQRIKEAAKTAVSIAEIARKTNLTRTQIDTTLARHRIIEKRIREQVANNKALLEARGTATIDDTPHDEVNNESNTAKNNARESTSVKKDKDSKCDIISNVKRYLIDASITATEQLPDMLANLCASGAKIILTSQTISTLQMLQRNRGITGKDARLILTMAVEKPENFEYVLLDDNNDDPHDSIIQYCKEHKDNLILITANKMMTMKAHLHGINVEYRKKDPMYHEEQQARKYKVTTFGQPVLPSNFKNTFANTSPIKEESAKKVTTITSAKTESSPSSKPISTATTQKNSNLESFKKVAARIGIVKDSNGDIGIDIFHTPSKSIRVYSYSNARIESGPCRLLMGDKILCATLENEEILFEVYKLISPSLEDSQICLFKKTFPKNTKNFYLSDETYRLFLHTFKKRLNL